KVALDNREDVIEIMGHPCRQLTERLHLLGLTELLLQLLAFRDVFHHSLEIQDLPRRIAHRADVTGYPDPVSVLADHLALEPMSLIVLTHFLQMLCALLGA